jgi:dolichol kinase
MITDYWNLIEGLYNTTFSLFFFLLAIIMFYIASKGLKARNRYGAISTAVCGIAFVIFGYYNSVASFLRYPYNGFMVWWIAIILILNVSFSQVIRREINQMKSEAENSETLCEVDRSESVLRRYIYRMRCEDPYAEDISVRMEIIRKSFHLTGLLILVAYYGLIFIPPVTQLVSDGVINLIHLVEPSYTFLWGDISSFPYVIGDPRAIIDLTMMALIGSLVFAIISDIIRIIWGPEYSLFNFLTKSMLRKKELNAAGPQIYIMTGFIFSYMIYMMGLLDIRVYFAGVLTACLSDAAAAIIGKTLGKHKILLRNKEKKSIEGFIAGTAVAYLIGFIFVGPIYAIICASIFFITDYFPSVTADNILNPVFIPIGIQLFIFLIGLPVGWG